jgi:hypothetical protein
VNVADSAPHWIGNLQPRLGRHGPARYNLPIPTACLADNIMTTSSFDLPVSEFTPKVTGVTFEVFRAGQTSPEQKTFLYDPDEQVCGESLNDPLLDCNQYFQGVVTDPSVTQARTSISFDHSVRPLLPIPSHAKAAGLKSIGDLIGVMVDMMTISGEFTEATQESMPFLHMAALAGKGLPRAC